MENNTKIGTRVLDEIGILDISGEITSFSEVVIDQAYENLSKTDLKKIIINFSDVNYINSAGMAVIISVLTKCRERQQSLRGFGLTGHFQKIFDMVGITKYMAHFGTEEEAFKSF
jgi:anti-anti-sigma factor